VVAVAQWRPRQWWQRGSAGVAGSGCSAERSRRGSAASVAAAVARGGGGMGRWWRDKQQSNNGCVGKRQREQKYEEQKWIVVGDCGRLRQLATQSQ